MDDIWIIVIAIVGSILCACAWFICCSCLLSCISAFCVDTSKNSVISIRILYRKTKSRLDEEEAVESGSESDSDKAPEESSVLPEESSVLPEDSPGFNDECPICLTGIEEDRVPAKCGHVYHKACISKLKNRHCPLCRGTMRGLPRDIKQILVG